MRWLNLLCIVLFFGAAGAYAQAGYPPLNFDAPLHVTKLVLPYKLHVTCSTYRGFVVQERYSEGEFGFDAATAPLRPWQGAVPCGAKLAPDAVDLHSDGFFWGALEHYVFLIEPDDNAFGGSSVEIFLEGDPNQLTTIEFAGAAKNALARVPGGFDLHYLAERTAVNQRRCAVSGSTGSACLAQLERIAGASISLSQCIKAEPANTPKDPVVLEYPALLSVRGAKVTLRDTGPAIACVPQD